MKRVWKVDVPVDDQRHEYQLPGESQPLHVACQHSHAMTAVGFGPMPTGVVQVWFEVDDGFDSLPRTLTVVGTGHPIGDDLSYIGTALDAGGSLVWHVYEVAPTGGHGE